MNQDQASAAVTGSALVVGGIYIFRRLSETNVTWSLSGGARVKQLAGVGNVAPTGPFVVGWGFTFLVLSLVAQAAPKLGGTFAILVATGAVLGNGPAVFGDVNKKLGGNPNAGGVVPSSGEPQATPPAGGFPNPVVVPRSAYPSK